jgi:pimeloyl-ACP methyl ester carboxylesterase
VGGIPRVERLIEAARKATVPVLLIQAQNDYDLAPTQVLSSEMEQAGKPHKRVILPAYGSTHQEGHGKFCAAADAWGSEVLAFLSATMKEQQK